MSAGSDDMRAKPLHGYETLAHASYERLNKIKLKDAGIALNAQTLKATDSSHNGYGYDL